MKREIIYPIFLECSELCTDTYWKNIFEDLAYAQTPYGTYISKGFFCCNYKNKEFSYKIEKKDTEKLFEDICNLCKRIGLLSHQKWCNIRKKNLKDFLIENYVIQKKKQYNLDIKQSKYLNYVIFVAMIFKIITMKDIEYEDGEIKNINGISFEDKKIILEKDLYHYDGRKCILIDDRKFISDNWEKYLNTLRKIVTP
jgi:hypothetical protein